MEPSDHSIQIPVRVEREMVQQSLIERDQFINIVSASLSLDIYGRMNRTFHSDEWKQKRLKEEEGDSVVNHLISSVPL